MSRIIKSPVKRFPGTVVLADPLTFDQLFAFQDAISAAQEARDNPARVNYAALPGVLACVEAWQLEGMPEVVTLETFPATPPVSIARVIGWLVDEIAQALQEAETVPND